MTADVSGSFDLKTFLSSGPIRSLIGGGAFLIAAIAIEYGVAVWHRGRDFDAIAEFTELQVVPYA